MNIRPFFALAEAERQAVFEFVTGAGASFPNLETMQQSMMGTWFDQGRNLLTLWAGGHSVIGTIGVITKDAQVRSEIFMTSLYVAPAHTPEGLPRLLQEAYGVAQSAAGVSPATVVRLGVRPETDYLQPHLVRAGFVVAYRVLEMTLPLTAPEAAPRCAAPVPPPGAVRFEPITAANVDDYVTVHNAAFLGSPNGAMTDAAEVGPELAAADFPEQYQVGYVAGSPAVTLVITVKDHTGNLDLLAVAPDFQGRGLGKVGLHRALDTLWKHGVTEVRLQVVETNTRAVDLYVQGGFTYDRTFATWFSGPPLFRERIRPSRPDRRPGRR